MEMQKPYRPGVGMMLVNKDNLIFLGQRLDNTNFWQMPQGGINPLENPEQAMRRELEEEIGTSQAYIIASQENYTYELPPEITTRLWNGKYIGQRQTWYALRFLGKDEDINIHTHHSEFRNWKWATKEDVMNCASFFKKNLYQSIFHDLWPKVLSELP